MNYVIFSKNGSISKQSINGLRQGAINSNELYVFADFDMGTSTSYLATICFIRSDEAKIGEIDMIETTATYPGTETIKRCRKFTFTKPILTVPGELGITIRFKTNIPYDDVEYSEVKVTGYVTTHVEESVMPELLTNDATWKARYAQLSNVVLALEERIASLEAKVN